MRRGQGHVRKLALAVAAALLLACGLFLPARAAFAHGNLDRAEPAPNSVLDGPPVRVAIWFTEPIEPSLSEIQVLDAQGQRVDVGESQVDPSDPSSLSVGLGPLEDGTYTVAWRNVSSVDGHRVRGSFVFSVGEPITGAASAPVSKQPLLQSPAEPVLRWLVLLSIMAVVGGLSFELLVWRPVLAGKDASGALHSAADRLASRALILVWSGVAMFLVASAGQLLVQAAGIYDVPLYRALGSPAASVLTDTDWGGQWLWRIGLMVGVAVFLGLVHTIPRRERYSRRDPEVRHRAFLGITLAPALGALLTLSLTSHGAATSGIRGAAVFSDYLHLLAATLWVGGLFHFALGLPILFRVLQPEERRAALSGMAPRFSTLATLSVGTLVITGLYGAWAQVTSPSAVSTPYGLTLVAKIGLVIPLLLLGALNLLWLRPRLAGEDQAGRWLRRFVTGEALIAALVLLAVGTLTSLEPARQVASREQTNQQKDLAFQETVEGAAITLEVSPGNVGPNDFKVSLEDRRGDPITNAIDVSLRLGYLGADLGTQNAIAVSNGDGTYILQGGLLSIAGPWQVELVVRRPDSFDARTAFRFEAAPVGIGSSAAIAPSSDTGKLLLGVELLLLGLLFLGAGIPLGGWWTKAGAGVMGPGLVATIVGLFFIGNLQLGGTPAGLVNPFPPNAESLAIGQEIYAGNCAACHGVTGRGDGPAGVGLDPPPLDLQVHVPLHPERDLFSFIKGGIPGTAMPVWGNQLTDDEIWHVVNYLETLPPP